MSAGGDGGAREAPAKGGSGVSGNTIDFDTFKSMDLRVAEITAVEEVEGADKLFRIMADLGDQGTRQLVAGLRPYYRREELLGRRVVVVANLEPAVIRGVESRGMLLASDGDRGVYLIEAGPESEPGDLIR